MSRSSLAFLSDELLAKEGGGYNGSLHVSQNDLKKQSEPNPNNVIKFPTRVQSPIGPTYPRLASLSSGYLFDDELTLHSMLRDSESLSCMVSSDPEREEAVSEFFRTVISLDDDDA
jgi:hypothetical protein